MDSWSSRILRTFACQGSHSSSPGVSGQGGPWEAKSPALGDGHAEPAGGTHEPGGAPAVLTRFIPSSGQGRATPFICRMGRRGGKGWCTPVPTRREQLATATASQACQLFSLCHRSGFFFFPPRFLTWPKSTCVLGSQQLGKFDPYKEPRRV